MTENTEKLGRLLLWTERKKEVEVKKKEHWEGHCHAVEDIIEIIR